MQRYKNLSGNSGVVEYELHPNLIKVRFSDGTVYWYTNASAGPSHVGLMKALARRGRGLSSYISTTVREAYARKERMPNR